MMGGKNLSDPRGQARCVRKNVVGRLVMSGRRCPEDLKNYQLPPGQMTRGQKSLMSSTAGFIELRGESCGHHPILVVCDIDGCADCSVCVRITCVRLGHSRDCAGCGQRYCRRRFQFVLFCHHRGCSLLKVQVTCHRNAVLEVRVAVRAKDDRSRFSWHWLRFWSPLQIPPLLDHTVSFRQACAEKVGDLFLGGIGFSSCRWQSFFDVVAAAPVVG